MMTRRSFLRRATIAVGAIVTASYNGLDFLATNIPAVNAAATALGLRSHAGINVWDVEYRSLIIGRLIPQALAYSTLNIPDGNLPPRAATWNGISYRWLAFDVNTRRAWYIRKD